MKITNEHTIAFTCNRREFLTKIALASVAFSMPTVFLGCSQEPQFQGSGKVPYKVWEEVLYYLKTSPDHLKGQMERLIREANPEDMFHFVRDQLYLIPSGDRRMGKSNAVKWGWKYALRSGMATAQEKAELLNYMYQQAGFSSKIVHEHTQIQTEDTMDFFLRAIDRPFAPQIPEKQLNKWAEELGYSSLPETDTIIDDDLNTANQLGEKIWSSLNLPSDYRFQSFDFRWDNQSTPTVELQHNGKTLYAHLCDPKVPFGQLRTSGNKISEAKPVLENKDKVSIEITYRDSITPKDEKELISHEWLATDLAGRQLNLMFLDNLIPEVRRVTPIQSIRTFTPAFALQAVEEDVSLMESHSKLADPITLGAKRINLQGKNQPVAIDGVSPKEKSDKGVQQVVQLEALAKTAGYPKVKLSVWPKDRQGNIIEGLSAKDFSILDENQPVTALLESNQKTPRVLMLSDASLSMPSEYRNEGMETFVSDLKKKIKSNYPDAIIKHWLTPSSLFTSLLKASNTDVDLIIYATDGHNDDTYNPKNKLIYKNGPPAIVLNVTDSKNKRFVDTFNKMAELTNGLHIQAKDPQKTIQAVASYLDNIEIQPYTFTYFSVAKKEKRNVKVLFDNQRLTAKTNYQFTNISELGPRIIGVYLKLKYANQPVVERVLAGWDYDIQRNEEPNEQMAKDVNDLMLGSIQFYFEGDGPTYSAALTDLLNYKLSTRNWGELLLDNKPMEAREAYDKGQLSLSGSVSNLMSPLENIGSTTTFTYASGLKIGMQSLKPGFITSEAISQFDYFPTSTYTTISINPETAFKTTLLKTSQLALKEYQLFQNSTMRQLENLNWTNLYAARDTGWLKNLPKEETLYWREKVFRKAKLRVFDVNASAKSFWDINEDTGEVYGIMPNGSGGGSSRQSYDTSGAEPYLKALGYLMDVLGHLNSLHPMGAHSLAIVALYGITLVKLYAIVSETILLMDASGMEDNIKKVLKQFACDVAEQTVGFKSNKIAWGLNKIIGDIDMKAMGCNS